MLRDAIECRASNFEWNIVVKTTVESLVFEILNIPFDAALFADQVSTLIGSNNKLECQQNSELQIWFNDRKPQNCQSKDWSIYWHSFIPQWSIQVV